MQAGCCKLCCACSGQSPLVLAAAQELEGCQHTLIGDEMLGMKGISGGQRRRVSGEGTRSWLPGTRPFADQPAACAPLKVSALCALLQWALNWSSLRGCCSWMNQPQARLLRERCLLPRCAPRPIIAST